MGKQLCEKKREKKREREREREGREGERERERGGRERDRESVVHRFFDPGPSVYVALSDGTVRSVLLTV